MTEIAKGPKTTRPPQQMNVLQYPHPLLSVKSEPVLTDIVSDVELQQLMDDMVETMKASRGVGLAAVQVGIPIRVLVLQDPQSGQITKVINPHVMEVSEEVVTEREGCLSFLGVYTNVKRPAEAVVEFFDEKGEKKTTVNDGLLGRAIQHEIDHLNGLTMLDRVSAVERTAIITEQKRIQRRVKGYMKKMQPKDKVRSRDLQKAKKAKRNKNKR